jgi:hypothetical protein
MHSGMFLPVAPPMSDEPPLVAMTSSGVVSTAVTDAGDADKKSGIAPLMGAWASHHWWWHLAAQGHQRQGSVILLRSWSS